MTTTMKNRTRTYVHFFGALTALSAVLSAVPARASLLTLGVDSADSSVSISLQAAASVLGQTFSINSPAINATPSGAAPAPNTIPPATTGFLGQVLISGSGPGTPGQLTNQGGGFDLSNNSTTINGPTILGQNGSVTLGLIAPHINIGATGFGLPLASAPGTGTYDASGLPLTVNGGTFSYSSTGYLNFIGSGSINFLSNLVTLNLPAGAHAQLTLGAGPPNAEPVTLTIPLAMTVPLFATGNSLLGASLNAIVGGTLVLTGVVNVPEPGSIILLMIGVVAAVPFVLKRIRRG